MYIPDNYDAYRQHEAEQERAYQEWLDKLPICSGCDKPIKDDHCYEIGGELFCEKCIEGSRALTENYMEK